MTVDGVLVESAGNGTWAWVALRLTPAPSLADTRAYADVAEPQRRAEALAAERAWLAAQWTTARGTRFELRYANDVTTTSVCCTLLGRVHGRDTGTVTAAAVSLRDRLAMAPRHVRAEPILDAAEVRRRLVLGRLDPMGSAELRKRLAWARCTRPDTDRNVCFAVTPLAAGTPAWEPVWHQLARLTGRTTVGIYLEPYPSSAQLTGSLEALAGEYARLATPAPVNPVWATAAPPDPFAVVAAPGYTEAVRRYTGRLYRIRVSVAAEAPIDPGFAELIADTVGGAAVCRPAPDDLDAAWRNLATLNRGWLDTTYRQGSPPGRLGDTERLLCDLVDESEAVTAFRFPYQVPGHLPLFDPATPGDRAGRPAGRPGSRDPGAPTFER